MKHQATFYPLTLELEVITQSDGSKVYNVSFGRDKFLKTIMECKSEKDARDLIMKIYAGVINHTDIEIIGV